jgi:hypothetical protein
MEAASSSSRSFPLASSLGSISEPSASEGESVGVVALAV